MAIERLIEGVRAFHAEMRGGGRDAYAALASGQSPEALVFACADSRIIPSELARSGPGELFTVRNVGNLVPPADAKGASTGDVSEASAIEYAVGTLGVEDIVVCGHSMCGAMGAILASGGGAKLPANLERWLDHARPAVDPARFPASLATAQDPRDALSQRSVLLQLEHLMTYPVVRDAVEKGRLRLHGWWFDIASASVRAFDDHRGAFFPIEAATLGG